MINPNPNHEALLAILNRRATEQTISDMVNCPGRRHDDRPVAGPGHACGDPTPWRFQTGMDFNLDGEILKSVWTIEVQS